MQIILNTIALVLEVYKWIVLARVLLSWLPRANIYIDPYNPIIRFLYRVTDPVLKPLRPYSQIGLADLSPLVVFIGVTAIQKVLRGQTSISYLVALSITLVIAFTVHEWAHAFTAFRLGDSTAKYQGRLSFDPRRHLDLLGTVMVLAYGFGWAKPVPVNPYNLRNGPKAGMVMVAVAGPISNLVMAAIVAIPMKLGMIEPASLFGTSSILTYFFPNPYQLFLVFVQLNVLLFFFNLLPIAPLDGFKVVSGLLPYPASRSFLKMEPFGPIILLLLIFVGGPVFSAIIYAPTNFVVNLLI